MTPAWILTSGSLQRLSGFAPLATRIEGKRRGSFGLGGKDGAESARRLFSVRPSKEKIVYGLSLKADAGMTPVATATPTAWVKFMQWSLWRAVSKCDLTLPALKLNISATSWWVFPRAAQMRHCSSRRDS